MMMLSPLVSEQEDEARILLLQCVCALFFPYLLFLLIWKVLFSMEFKQFIYHSLYALSNEY
jgi:hypothetical protein